jgi:hypothetical protein
VLADIKPSRYVPIWWLVLPPSDADTIDWIYDLGYCDALSFFAKEGLLEACTHREGNDAHPHACRYVSRHTFPYVYSILDVLASCVRDL